MPEKSFVYLPDSENAIFVDIYEERVRAHEKHHDMGNCMCAYSHNDPRWLPVLAEELGEVARTICEQNNLAWSYPEDCEDCDNTYYSDLRKELVQVAAIACAWISAIDRRESERIT